MNMMQIASLLNPAPDQQVVKVAFTIDEFCGSFGVGRSYVYEEIKAGRLKSRKAGRRTLITADDARAWLSSLPFG